MTKLGGPGPGRSRGGGRRRFFHCTGHLHASNRDLDSERLQSFASGVTAKLPRNLNVTHSAVPVSPQLWCSFPRWEGFSCTGTSLHEEIRGLSSLGMTRIFKFYVSSKIFAPPGLFKGPLNPLNPLRDQSEASKKQAARMPRPAPGPAAGCCSQASSPARSSARLHRWTAHLQHE